MRLLRVSRLGDDDVDPALSREFLGDPRHHIAVAREASRIVGMASALHYVHPDKAAQLFINEVGVAPTHEGRGIGAKLLRALLGRGRELGCTEAWVATEAGNAAARRLYSKVGGIEDPGPFVIYSFPLEEGT